MDNLIGFFERLLAVLLLPATLYGAGGALLHARHKNEPLRQTVTKLIGGAIITNMLCPVIQAHMPERWHYTLFFLAGWGGLEFVSRCYEAAVSALERRIQRQINPDKE